EAALICGKGPNVHCFQGPEALLAPGSSDQRDAKRARKRLREHGEHSAVEGHDAPLVASRLPRSSSACRVRGMRRALVALLVVLAFAPACPPRAQPTARAIPFRFVLERQIVFPMTIDGKPAEAWLDSGAGATVVDARF